ncbi:DUF2339 domain-containing protein [Candidatus Gracilibacteria bacterium]|nr:DUF2339 domain-containing protein [Candidatus Gracilibacteria bacterium]
MYQIFTRIRLILAVIAGISVFAIDEELFLFAIGASAFVYFVLLSDSFFEESTENKERRPAFPTEPQDISQEKIVVGLDEEIQNREIGSMFPKVFEDEQSESKTISALKHENLYEENSESKEQNIALNSQDEYSHSHSEYKNTPSEPGVIEKFFSENLLAKLGGILVFLGVLFLLSLIYSIIGPVAKMCIGLAIGFTCYGAGVFLDKKGYINESRIVFGTAILINYLVILSGRYLLGDDASSSGTLLTVSTTFIFLILNTIFAVVTALVYNSRPLLIFAFLFAYANPFLLGTSSSEPYTLLGYTLIITLGAMFMAYKRKDEILFPLSFVIAAVMFLIAPWSDANGWVAKLLCINLLGTVALYVSSEFEKRFQNLSEILIGGTFFLIGVMGLLGIMNLSQVQLMILGASSLGLMFFSYFKMNRSVYLYSIGTLGAVLTLSPALFASIGDVSTSIISFVIIFVFALLNIGVILTKNKDLLAGNLGNIISGLVSGALFLSFMIYNFGNVYFPGVAQGFAFFGLAVIYSSLAFFVVQKIGIKELQSQEKYQNIFYTISALGVSLFSLAVAFVFAENPEIISIVWILEASVLFFLAQKTSSQKIALAGLILFVIGAARLSFLMFNGLQGDYGMLVTAGIIFAVLIYNLVLFYKNDSKSQKVLPGEFYTVHDVVHIFLTMLVMYIGHNVLGIRGDWYSLLYVSSWIAVLWVIYQNIGSTGLKKVYIVVYGFLLFSHIALFLDDLGRDSLSLGISSIIFAMYTTPLVYNYFSKRPNDQKIFLTLFAGYFFILSTLYIYHISQITFAVTLYWGVLSFILLGYGISKNILPLRTLGLYLITLTAGKVFLYDIWMTVDDTISRVVALIIIGILMIVLSTMYTRKYGNNLNAEFSPENLFGKNTHKEYSEQEQKSQNSKTLDTPTGVMQEIAKTDVSNYSAVRMKVTGSGKVFTIRAINLIKIAKIIETSHGEKTFHPGELKDIQETILSEYKTELPKTQFEKLKEVVAAFVENGGEIEFVERR